MFVEQQLHGGIPVCFIGGGAFRCLGVRWIDVSCKSIGYASQLGMIVVKFATDHRDAGNLVPGKVGCFGGVVGAGCRSCRVSQVDLSTENTPCFLSAEVTASTFCFSFEFHLCLVHLAGSGLWVAGYQHQGDPGPVTTLTFP